MIQKESSQREWTRYTGIFLVAKVRQILEYTYSSLDYIEYDV